MEQLTLTGQTRTFTCRSCGEEKPSDHGNRRICKPCVEAGAYGRKIERMVTCQTCGDSHMKRVSMGQRRAQCIRCTRMRARSSMTDYRRTLKRMASDARGRQKRKAAFIYLETRCAVCGHPVWQDARAVARKVRACAAFRCAYEVRHNADAYKDMTAIKNHRRRTASKAGEDVRKSVVWERDGGVCHICQRPADPDNWHLEHIVPISRGGEHTYSNVAVSHPACNLAKGSRVA